MLKARMATKKFADVFQTYLSWGKTVLLAGRVLPLAKCKEVSTSRPGSQKTLDESGGSVPGGNLANEFAEVQ